MAKKRKRNAAGSARPSKPSAKKKIAKDPNASKLKKSRITTKPIEEEKPATTVPSPEDKAKELEERFAQLETRIDAFLKASTASVFGVLPDTDLLLSIYDVLKDLPIPSVIARLKKLPHVLLIAARKGCDERGVKPGSGTQALVRSLTKMALGARVSVPDEVDNVRVRRSAFRPGGNGEPTKAELEAISKPGKWALQLLTGCVRADAEKNDAASAVDEQACLRHGDTSRVFVTPRDFLDTTMAEHYVSSVIERVQRLSRSKNLAYEEAYEVFTSICEGLCPVVSNPTFKPVVNAVILSASRMRPPLQSSLSRHCGRDSIFPDSFCDSFINSKGTESIFREASSSVRRALLKVSHRSWLFHLHAVQNEFSGGTMPSATAEKEAMSDLAFVAAEDVCRHWELMDQLRKEISSDSEPFSTRLWKQRNFYRAALDEIVRVVCQTQDDSVDGMESRRYITPLFRRFPTRYRHLVQAASALGSSVLHRLENGQRNIAAGPKGMMVVFDGLGLDRSTNISPNAHAILLCIEGLLEKLCWATGYVVSDAKKANEQLTSQSRLFHVICTVCSVLEVIRVPGGAWAECEETVRQRATAMKDILEFITNGKRMPSKRQGEWRMEGMFAMAVCGIMHGTTVTGMQQFCAFLEKEEWYELRRAMEISREMTGGQFREGVEKLYSELMRNAPEQGTSAALKQ